MRVYSRLQSEKVIKTVEKLHNRITERFPESGLSEVCGELTSLAKETAQRAHKISQPNNILRVLVSAIIIAGCTALISIFYLIPPFEEEPSGAFVYFQGIEAIINTIVLTGAAIFSLWTMEERIKRRQSLKYLDELRAITHVIDMHQLTKDPSAILAGGPKTQSSPQREMSEFELTRYLDYCSEMLSLTSKLAAFYSQDFRNPSVVSTVNDLELLTTNMSRKIWQKIILLKSTNTGSENTVNYTSG